MTAFMVVFTHDGSFEPLVSTAQAAMPRKHNITIRLNTLIFSPLVYVLWLANCHCQRRLLVTGRVGKVAGGGAPVNVGDVVRLALKRPGRIRQHEEHIGFACGARQERRHATRRRVRHASRGRPSEESHGAS